MKRCTFFFADVGFLITKQMKLFLKIERKSSLILCVFGGKTTTIQISAGKINLTCSNVADLIEIFNFERFAF